jgi:hypothetical protein
MMTSAGSFSKSSSVQTSLNIERNAGHRMDQTVRSVSPAALDRRLRPCVPSGWFKHTGGVTTTGVSIDVTAVLCEARSVLSRCGVSDRIVDGLVSPVEQRAVGPEPVQLLELWGSAAGLSVKLFNVGARPLALELLSGLPGDVDAVSLAASCRLARAHVHVDDAMPVARRVTDEQLGAFYLLAERDLDEALSLTLDVLDGYVAHGIINQQERLAAAAELSGAARSLTDTTPHVVLRKDSGRPVVQALLARVAPDQLDLSLPLPAATVVQARAADSLVGVDAGVVLAGDTEETFTLAAALWNPAAPASAADALASARRVLTQRT